MRKAGRHRPRDRALASLAATLFLCACAVQKPPPPPAPTARVVHRPQPHHPVPRPGHKPAPPPEIALAKPGSGSPAAGQHDALIGLDQPEALHLLGPAAETREEPPATVWRYSTPSCELDLYFYLDLRSGRMRTLHYAFKGDTGDDTKRRACVQSIIAARSS